MYFEMKETTSYQFLEQINTGTLLEERIKLMLQDPNISIVRFQNGKLSYVIGRGEFVEVEEWLLSLEETIIVMNTITEKILEIAEEEGQEGEVIFQDAHLQFENFEDYSIIDLIDRLEESLFILEFSKYDYNGKRDIQEEDLPL